MKRTFLAVVFVFFLAMFVNGCATKGGSGMASEPGKENHTLTIATGDSYEFCDRWQVGDTVKFSYSSSKPVTFNVHYHAKHKKAYSIKDTLSDEFSGSFTVDNDEIHCGMWQNNNDKFIKLSFEVEVMK